MQMMTCIKIKRPLKSEKRKNQNKLYTITAVRRFFYVL
jgi:hypothetical protein